MEHFPEATATFQKALLLRQELNQTELALESQAGLAHLLLAQGDLSQALTLVEEIADYLEINSLDEADDPFLMYLICYRVLAAAQSPQAEIILQSAYDLLQKAGR